ncbi:MAG TPA: COX15/CtaA family protein [Hyphomicrobium sp.]|nr:COX15/CtaA family protein [Hyphomicrobium sp.]
MANAAANRSALRAEHVAESGYALVEAWLWFVAALVFAMVAVGGATRLTGSGLSITEWKPIMGAIPPLNEADWLAAFDKYKQIPQYKLINEGMALSDFKTIFWWEWGHRLLGRIIGAAFALPLIFFWARGWLRRGTAGKYAGLLALGAIQGAIGWYMVASGLSERVSVSQYRLALHLSGALAIFALLVWLALDERRARLGGSPAIVTGFVRAMAAVLAGFIFLQTVLGAFVAGLKAGLIYNTWPSMDGQFIPSDYWIDGHGLMSFFEGHAAAQFNHRIVAYIVLAAALVQVIAILRAGATAAAKSSGVLLLLTTAAQALIGILTLVWHVPLTLGVLHQAGAVVVLGVAVWHLFAVHDARKV